MWWRDVRPIAVPGEAGAGMTDLLYSEVEEDLRASVQSLLRDRSSLHRVLSRTESAETVDVALWRALATDLGLAGLIVPEKLGGAGASAREAAVVLEELGRAVAPVPFLGSAVVATTVLLGCDGVDDLIGALARGERTAALAVPFSTPPGIVTPSVIADTEDLLVGTITSVADALAADVLLVPTDRGLFQIDTAAVGVTVTPVVSFDMTRQLVDITFTGAAGALVAGVEAGAAAVSHALTVGAALLASEQYGAAAWCLDETVDYMKNRYQFGRQIGSFQALKHRIADVWVDVTQARAVARYAADCVATERCRSARGSGGGAGVQLRRRRTHRRGVSATAWRHRVHLGAPDPPLPQAGQVGVDRVRHGGRPSGDSRHGGEPASAGLSRSVPVRQDGLVRVRPVSMPLLLDEIAATLIGRGGQRQRVAIDGAAGLAPAEFGHGLAEALRDQGQPALHISTDDFLLPASQRFEFGKTDVESFYLGWRDESGLRREVLDPAAPDGHRARCCRRCGGSTSIAPPAPNTSPCHRPASWS